MAGIGSILDGLLDPVKDIVSEVVVDKDKRDQVNLELRRIEDQAEARLVQLQQGQIEVNKVEAASNSTFVAGWRPAVGWVGAAGMAWTVLLLPICSWTASVIFGYRGPFPAIEADVLLYTLGGMLGFGGLRTFEKYKGVASNDMQIQPQASNTSSSTTTTTVETNTKTGAVSVETAPAAVAKKKKKFKLF